MSDSKSSSVENVPGLNVKDGGEAIHKLRKQIDAVDPDRFAIMNVPIARAAITGFSAAPKLAKYRDAIVANFSEFDATMIDNLALYALAAYTADANCGPAGLSFESEFHDAVTLKDDFVSAVPPLIRRNKLNHVDVDGIDNGNGYRVLPTALNRYARAFRNRWDDVKNLTTISESDLDRATHLASVIVVKLGTSDSPPLSDEELLRRRTWTLFFNAYEECRRAIEWLRFYEGDAASIMPNLHDQGGGRSKPVAPAPTDTTTLSVGSKEIRVKGDGGAGDSKGVAATAQSVPVTGKPVAGTGNGEPFEK